MNFASKTDGTAQPQTTAALEPHKLQAATKAALEKLSGNLERFTAVFPDDTTVDGVYLPREGNVGWTTSFWTGMLWLAFELTGDEKYRRAAELQVTSFAARIRDRVAVNHHDLGFLYTLSCVAAYRLTGSEEAKAAALAAAEYLMTRYLAKASILQAWGDLDHPEEQGRMIVDCLMNLPLLYWASEVTGDRRYRDAAYAHARQAQQFIVRENSSTFHTYFFDVQTGEALHGKTHQGASDDSCWARGQAWGIYGFPLNYVYTRDGDFLTVACDLAEYFLAHLPADLVAYWDLDYGDGSGEERDSSASAIAVCGLLELSKWLPEGETKARYHRAALAILGSLIDNYATKPHTASNALLLHGVYSKPGGVGVDEANLWGDYFYLEALTRVLKEWQLYW